MNLTLTRDKYREDGIFSTLTDEQGGRVAVTLEHAYDNGRTAGSLSCKKALISVSEGHIGCIV